MIPFIAVLLALLPMSQPPSQTKTRIVAMGDSTTAGTPAFKSPREAPPKGSGDETSQYAYWLMKAHPGYGAWIHEAHHATKRDAPSGTALLLRDAIIQAGYDRAIDVSSTRAGTIPGTHTVGFDCSSDTIELTHTARDRRGFGAGALVAARWIQGKMGWYSMQDVLKG